MSRTLSFRLCIFVLLLLVLPLAIAAEISPNIEFRTYPIGTGPDAFDQPGVDFQLIQGNWQVGSGGVFGADTPGIHTLQIVFDDPQTQLNYDWASGAGAPDVPIMEFFHCGIRIHTQQSVMANPPVPFDRVRITMTLIGPQTLGYNELGSTETAGPVPCPVGEDLTSSGPIIDLATIPPDDRLNYGQGDSSFGIAYAQPDNGITIYGINPDSTGYLATNVPPEDLPTCDPGPRENQLLARSADGKYTIWLLTTCEYQVNMGPDGEGKVHVITWHGIPPIKESIKFEDFNVFDILDG